MHGALFFVEVEIRHHEVVFIQPLVVGLEKLRVIGHHGAVVVVDGIVLVEIVALAGIEDEIDAHVEQAFDMPVHELGGIARRVARDGVLAPEVELARASVGEHDFKAARLEKARPERELFIHDELQREPHLPALSGKPRRKREQLFVLIGIDIGHVLGPREPRAALALVARNKAAAVREGQNIDGAVRGAALADDGARRIGEAVELGGRCERADERSSRVLSLA